jgi:hypothetical protein
MVAVSFSDWTSADVTFHKPVKEQESLAQDEAMTTRAKAKRGKSSFFMRKLDFNFCKATHEKYAKKI